MKGEQKQTSLRELVAKQAAQLELQTKRITELELQLAKALKNSSNSSKSPSSDIVKPPNAAGSVKKLASTHAVRNPG